MTRALMFAVTAPFAACSLSADDTASDMKALQGRWELVRADDSDGIARKRGFEKHVLVVAGEKMTVEPAGDEAEPPLPFKLDPAKTPRRIDFRTAGKDKAGVPRLGIYTLDGDSFRVCYSSVVPAAERLRPTDFTINEGSGRLLLEYKRVK